ncbi:MAG: hypothetical protein ABIN89_00795 [Chitinophagaceae bacterium]
MKKLLTPLTAVVLSLFISPSSFSQNTVNLSRFSQPANTDSSVAGLNASNPKSKTSVSAEKYCARALKHFNGLFPAVTNARWYADNNTISTYSMQDSVCTRVCYNKKGSWLHTSISSPGNKLAATKRALVLNNFPGYTIMGTIEIHEQQLVLYFVNIENERNIKQLIIYNGNVSIYDEFERAR